MQHAAAPTAERSARVERFDTVIIGAGQAGLATGYYLAERDEAGVSRAGRVRHT